MSRSPRRLLLRLLWPALLLALLAWALSRAPLGEIAATLRTARGDLLLALLGLNVVIFALTAARWWIIVRAEARAVPFGVLLRVRLAAFALSYFTPGPQVGGEPLQVIALRRYGVTLSRATAAVVLDKLLEFLANFLFLGIGLMAILQSGLLELTVHRALPLLALLLWPAVHLALLYLAIHPLSALARPFARRVKRHSPAGRALRLIMVSEMLAGLFCRRHPRALLAALGVSLLAWVGMAVEYQLMAWTLRLALQPAQALSGLTLARLAFLAPLPGGLGALEASQVMAMTALGLPAAAGLSLSLLMRARDLLLGGLGLLLAGMDHERTPGILSG